MLGSHIKKQKNIFFSKGSLDIKFDCLLRNYFFFRQLSCVESLWHQFALVAEQVHITITKG